MHVRPASSVKSPACTQVSARSLQSLLALPALVELNAWAFLDDLLDPITLSVQRTLRENALKAALRELQAAFRSKGRSLICSNNTVVH